MPGGYCQSRGSRGPSRAGIGGPRRSPPGTRTRGGRRPTSSRCHSTCRATWPRPGALRVLGGTPRIRAACARRSATYPCGVCSAERHVSARRVLGGAPGHATYPRCGPLGRASGSATCSGAACSSKPSAAGHGLLGGVLGHATCPGGPRRLSWAHLSVTPAEVRYSYRQHKGIPASASTPRSCPS